MRMRPGVRSVSRGSMRRHCLALLGALALSAAALDTIAQDCPATDPNQNYNCPIGPAYTVPGWGNVPWSLPQYYQSIQAGDLDGDGRDELIGRDANGVHVWSFNTALGVWQPWLSSDGTGRLVLALTDANQWNQAPYYTGMMLINLAGRSGKVLAVRSVDGLLLYGLTRGASVQGLDLPAGAWTTLSSGGPFADSDCFTNQSCWNTLPYYRYLRFADIDGQPGDEAIGWGGQGVVAFQWTGSGWSALTGLPQLGDAATIQGFGYPASLQFGDLDGQPGQELLHSFLDGVRAFKYVAGANGGTWTQLPTLTAFGSLCGVDPMCIASLRTTTLGQGPAVVTTLVPGCSAAGGGLGGARYNATTQSWSTVFSGGPLDDCDGFNVPQYYETVQFARITGNTQPELVVRGDAGILVYQWNGTSWNPISINVPALADSVWASDPSYWRTIRTANIDSSGRAALIARGQTGMRTWLWQNGTFVRPQPYGGFPPFAGDQGTAYALLNAFLGLTGTIRDTYTDPTVDNSASALRGYVSQIVNARNGCQNEISGNPPQYQTCDPLIGATNPSYTTMVNQVIKELWWAASTVDHFSAVQTMQNALFVTQNSEFPSLTDNLQLPQASDDTAFVDFLNLFATIGTLISGLTGQFELGIAADSVAVLASALGAFQDPQATTYASTYEQIQGQIASLQQGAQTSNLAQKHHVLSDYGLLSTIGQLTASQTWTVDQAGYLSFSRQAFTQWVYQAFLPILWNRYEVIGCGALLNGVCDPPSDDVNIASYTSRPGPDGSPTVDFVGLLPAVNQDANPICNWSCPAGGGSCNETCSFPTPVATQVNMVFTPVSPACTYNAQVGTAWVYADPSASPPTQGCTLGATQGIFTNQSGWNFPVVQMNMGDQYFAIDGTSRASDIETPASRLRLSGSTRLDVPSLDLRGAKVTFRRLLGEAYAGGELVDDQAGRDFVPIVLTPDRRASATQATFETAAGQSPRTSANLRWKPNKQELSFDVAVDVARIAEPQQCRAAPATTTLHLSLTIEGGGLPRPLTLSQVGDWECSFDRSGTVKSLRFVGHPVHELTTK